MKVYGKRILSSDLRFVFTFADEKVSTADAMNIKRLDEMVCEIPRWHPTSLSDVIHVLGQIANGGDVRISVEEITDNDD